MTNGPPYRQLRNVFLIVLGLSALWGLTAVVLDRADKDAMDADTLPVEVNGGGDLTLAIPDGPSFDVVRISRGGTGVIAGRAPAGSLVELLADGEPIGSVTADGNGEWVLILERPLESGPAELSLRSTLPGEERADESADVVVVSVPETAGDRFMDPQNDGVVAVLTKRDGTGASRVLQRPGADAVSEIGDALTVETVDIGEAGTVIYTGRAVPRKDVRLYLDNTFIGIARANDDGAWQFAPSESLSPGPHVLRLDQMFGDDDVHMRIEQPFETGSPLDYNLAEGEVIVKPGNSLWHIARRLYGSGFQYTLIFQANSEKIRDPDLIYPGQRFKLPSRRGVAEGEGG